MLLLLVGVRVERWGSRYLFRSRPTAHLQLRAEPSHNHAIGNVPVQRRHLLLLLVEVAGVGAVLLLWRLRLLRLGRAPGGESRVGWRSLMGVMLLLKSSRRRGLVVVMLLELLQWR